MGKLIYMNLISLDGFIEDASGKFDWAMPSEEVHAFINERASAVTTEIYGRNLYETMKVWEDIDLTDQPGAVAEFAELWRNSDKVVISSTLKSLETERSTLQSSFDPDAVTRIKNTADGDVSIGGASLAASAFEAGLIDVVDLTVAPVSVGGGKPALPPGQRVDLELIDEHRFANGFINLRYAVRR